MTMLGKKDIIYTIKTMLTKLALLLQTSGQRSLLVRARGEEGTRKGVVDCFESDEMKDELPIRSGKPILHFDKRRPIIRAIPYPTQRRYTLDSNKLSEIKLYNDSAIIILFNKRKLTNEFKNNF